MAVPFASSVESIENDSGRGARLLLGVTALAFALWSIWLLFGELEVSRATEWARIEAAETARPLQARVVGRVVQNDLELGQHVNEGDILVRLDATTEEMRLAEEIARRDAARDELIMARAELDVERKILESLRKLGSATTATLETQKRTADKIASLTEEETRRIRRLDELQAIAEMSVIEQEAKHERASGEASLRRAELLRSSASLEVDIGEREARILRLDHTTTKLAGAVRMSELAIAQLENELERSRIRAPVTGFVAELVDVGAGELVDVGQRLGTIVPDGAVRAIAEFPPRDVVGLVSVGQSATLRLDAFPWLRHGALRGTVVAVGLIPTNGRVRVEIALDPSPPVPLHHGLTGTAEVHLQTTTPLRLIMRAAGAFLSDSSVDGNAGPP